MNPTTSVTSSYASLPARRGGWLVPRRGVLATVLLSAGALLGLEAICRAQFPSAARAEDQPSYACFRVAVDPLYYWVFEANGPNLRYPGFNGFTLTSPGLFDRHTYIGESKGYNLPPIYPIDYPVDVGGSLFPSQGDYLVPGPFPGIFPNGTWPFPASAPSPLRTMLTEMQAVHLSGAFSNCVGSPMLPQSGPVEVVAGYHNNLPRCDGMVQTKTTGADFPARSFFDIYSEITLPPVGGHGDVPAFPTTGIVLYNSDPLFVVNDAVDKLPPTLGYLHDPATAAVALKFKFSGSDGAGHSWQAGDVLGQLELAGHGLFDPCAKNTRALEFIAQVLGTPGHSAPGAPLGGLYPNTQYPWTNSTYDSIKGTNLAGQPLDALTFTNVGSQYTARHFSVSGFTDPITLPDFGDSASYTNTNVTVSMEWSYGLLDNFFPGSATGTMEVLIVNTNGGSGGTTNYYLELQKLELTGTTLFGSFMIRESPTLVSTGKHIVHTGGPGYNIAGYFDALLEMSANNGASWMPADLPFRLRLSNPPCGANVCSLYVTHTATGTVLNWANPAYHLQGSASLAPAVWVDIPGVSGLNLPASDPYQFYRLACE